MLSVADTEIDWIAYMDQVEGFLEVWLIELGYAYRLQRHKMQHLS